MASTANTVPGYLGANGPKTPLSPPSDGVWRASIFTQIAKRNERQSNNYVNIIKSYQALLAKVATLEEEGESQRASIVTLTAEKSALTTRVTALQAATEGMDGEKIGKLEAELAEKQQELNTLYKDKALLAETSLLLKTDAERADERLQEKQNEIEDLKKKLEESEANCHAYVQALEDSARTEKLNSEEYAALQKEFRDRDDRLRALTAEHEQLVARWLEKSKADAELMNDNNQNFYQKQQADQAETISRIANEEVTGIVPESLSMANVVGGVPKQASRNFLGHDSEINTVSFAINGTMYATGSGDKTVKIWDYASGKVQHKLRGSAQSVMSVAFTDDCELVCGSSNDNTARIWDLKSGRLRHNLTGHTGKIYATQFTHDSHHIVSGSHDRSLKLWDAERGYCLRTILCYSSVNDLALSRDGYAVYSGHVDSKLRVWDTKTGDAVHEIGHLHSNQITSVTLTTDYNYILTNSRDNTLKLVDMRRLEAVTTMSAPAFRSPFNWSGATLSPDGRYAACGGQDGSVFVWETQTGNLERTLKAHSAPVAACAWNPMTRGLVSVDKDRNIVVWE